MTLIGWILMLGSVGFVLALNVFCFWRVAKTSVTSDRLRAPLEIDTHEDAE